MRLYCSLLLLCLSYSGHALGNSVNDLSELDGTWVLSSQGFGPEELSTTWWFNKRTDEDDLGYDPKYDRECGYDDIYIIDGGDFRIDQGGLTWLEQWQGGEVCGEPIPPFDGSESAAVEYDSESEVLTLQGEGAYIGRALQTFGSVSYNVYFTDNGLTLTNFREDMQGWWTFELERCDYQPYADDDGDGVLNHYDALMMVAAASVDTDRDGYPDSWNPGATAEQIADSGLELDVFPSNPNEWFDSDGDGFGDNSDYDADNDLVPNMGTQGTRDAFPRDPAASVDSDNDGQPDRWNHTATAEQINNSSLVIDDDPGGITDGVFPVDISFTNGIGSETMFVDESSREYTVQRPGFGFTGIIPSPYFVPEVGGYLSFEASIPSGASAGLTFALLQECTFNLCEYDLFETETFLIAGSEVKSYSVEVPKPVSQPGIS